MITEELKHILDSLPSGIHEQARELVKTWKTANDRIINEIFELSEEENDELQQIADEAKGKLFTLLFGPLYHIGTHDLDIRDILKSYIIARYYGWEPKEEDLEEIISNTSYFNFNVDDAIYEVLTMPSRDGNPITRKQKSFINLRYQTYSNN